MVDTARLDALERALGHHFGRRALLEEALTHSSYANERPKLAPRDNERLEFLGDAVIGAVVAELLFEAFPDASEGELTRRRATLVCADGLADIARGLSLGSALRLGKGEQRNAGAERPRLLCCAIEACVGAVWVDGGPLAARAVVRGLFADRIQEEMPGNDAKSRIQELVQRERGETPRYRLLETTGPEHALIFRVELIIADAPVSEGVGRSKFEAEQEAARVALSGMSEAAS